MARFVLEPQPEGGRGEFRLWLRCRARAPPEPDHPTPVAKFCIAERSVAAPHANKRCSKLLFTQQTNRHLGRKSSGRSGVVGLGKEPLCGSAAEARQRGKWRLPFALVLTKRMGMSHFPLPPAPRKGSMPAARRIPRVPLPLGFQKPRLNQR
jgi:hypothetical protein